MTKEEYARMIFLKNQINSTYGIPPKKLENVDELFDEYIKLREKFTECRGVIEK